MPFDPQEAIELHYLVQQKIESLKKELLYMKDHQYKTDNSLVDKWQKQAQIRMLQKMLRVAARKANKK